ncbi:MAG: hypothetical protein ACPG4Z_06965 [Chitinophagales bacterium]
MITVETEFTREDIKNAIELHYNHKFPIKSKLMLIVGFLMVVAGLSMTFMGWPVEQPYLKFLFVGIGIFYIGYYFYRKKQMLDRAAKNSSLVAKHKISVSENSVSFLGEKGKSEKKWAEIEDKAVDEKTILLYFTVDQFYILPKRMYNADELKTVEDTIAKNMS